MKSPLKLSAPEKPLSAREKFTHRTARSYCLKHFQRVFCNLLAVACPLAASTAQASPSSQQLSPPQQSSSQPSPAQSQPPSPAQPAAPAQPPQKEDSLAEAARKAKEKKSATAKRKVYTEDDLSSLKGPGVSVVGEAPKKGAGPSRPLDPDGDGGQNNEEYWRRRAREILDQITAVDEEIAQKKDEIKRYGSGGFDVTTGMKQNIAYINDRNGQVKSLGESKSESREAVGRSAGRGSQSRGGPLLVPLNGPRTRPACDESRFAHSHKAARGVRIPQTKLLCKKKYPHQN